MMEGDMRPRTQLSEEQKERLEFLLSKTKTKGDFQRVQCMWLRAALNLSSADAARAMGWSRSTVKIIQSRYLREGEKVLLGKGRGGKRYSNLTGQEEEDLLSSFLEQARGGGVLVVGEIKAAYEKKAGKQVPKSTVYRMLARHGWRKIMPRPKHPKAEIGSQEAFKKNSLRLSRKK
jgi:transposase